MNTENLGDPPAKGSEAGPDRAALWVLSLFAYFLLCILGIMVLGPMIKDPTSLTSLALLFVAAPLVACGDAICQALLEGWTKR